MEGRRQMSDKGHDEEFQRDERVVKRVQSYLPGYREYRGKEDIRDADRFLRVSLSQKIGIAKGELERAKNSLLEEGLSARLDEIDSLINALRRIDGEISYAELGYATLSSDQGEENEEDFGRISELDTLLNDYLTSMLKTCGDLRTAAAAGELATMKDGMDSIRALIDFVSETFRRRMTLLRQLGV